MKIINTKNKMLIIIGVALILLLSILQVKSLAASKDIITIQEKENQYLIYIDEMLNQNFEFSFSNSKEGATLNYITSAKDNNGNNIAYVDEELKNNYFSDGRSYIWVRAGDKIIINAEEIDINNVITKEQLKTIETLTERIEVEAKAEDEKITIKGKEANTYYYKIYATNSNESYNKLSNLVEDINKYDSKTSIVTELKGYTELYQLYNALLEETKNEEWIKAENLEITKPYEAKDNQQYILWLKDSEGNIDIQFLTAYEEKVTEIKEDKVNKEIVTSLPNTYDETTTLVIALGIVILAIAVVLIIRKKYKSSAKRG